MKQGYFFNLPNQISLLRILLSPVFYFYFLLPDQFSAIIAVSVFTIASISDWLDGYLARKLGLISRVGKFLDPLADKVLTSIAFWAFYVLEIMPLWMVLIIVIRDITLTFYRVYEEFKGKSIPANLFAKWKTAIQLITIYLVIIAVLFPKIFTGFSDIDYWMTWFLASDVLYGIFLFVTVYTLVSGIVYLYQDFVMNVKQEEEIDS